MDNTSIGAGKVSRQIINRDSLQLEYFDKIKSRKSWMWWLSFIAISLITLIILIAVSRTLFMINTFSHVADGKVLLARFDFITSAWHIYFISLVALTTLLSGFIYINRLTWKDDKSKSDNDDDKMIDSLSPQLKLLNEMVALVKNINKADG